MRIRWLSRLHEVVVEGDYVITQGRFSGNGARPWIAADVVCIEGGKLAEHWESFRTRSPRPSA
jgi:predicted SnoaL-like aldol condensation-catalyzing enzyme